MGSLLVSIRHNALIRLFLAFFIFGVYGMSVSAAEIRGPQFSGDGKTLFFDVCTKEKWCVIHSYNLETKDLGYYQPRPGKIWMMASPSRAGDKLVFIEFPEGSSSLDLQDALPQAQVMVMNMDGGGLRALTSQPGLKTFPSFSRSGQLVLFNQAGLIRDRGKTPASRYDLWEVEVDTGTTRMFAGPFEFYGAGRSYYIGDGPEALVNADTSFIHLNRSRMNASDFARKTNNSQIYSIQRGASTLADPLFTDVSFSDGQCVDDFATAFHFGTLPKQGIRILRRHAGNVTGSWPLPPYPSDIRGLSPKGTAVSSDGHLFAMGINEDHGREKVGRLWLLDVESGAWREIVPPASARRINH